jgi:hypothetical protein
VAGYQCTTIRWLNVQRYQQTTVASIRRMVNEEFVTSLNVLEKNVQQIIINVWGSGCCKPEPSTLV